MNIADILKYGHQTVVKTVDGLPGGAWEQPGVCGVWAVKDIVAHLASFEHVLVDVLHTLLNQATTPHLDAFRKPGFNDAEVAKRKSLRPADVLSEYSETHAEAMALVGRIPAETCRRNGTLPLSLDGDRFVASDGVLAGAQLAEGVGAPAPQ
jgi:hypothetical protein